MRDLSIYDNGADPNVERVEGEGNYGAFKIRLDDTQGRE